MIIKFENKSISKGDLAQSLMAENQKFDCALPSLWLEKINKYFPDNDLDRFGNLSAHFVWTYDESNKSEYPMPITKIGCEILGVLSLSIK